MFFNLSSAVQLEYAFNIIAASQVLHIYFHCDCSKDFLENTFTVPLIYSTNTASEIVCMATMVDMIMAT